METSYLTVASVSLEIVILSKKLVSSPQNGRLMKVAMGAEEEVKEMAKRAAAAARKWREYSRKGADRPPAFKLPESVSNKD